MDRLVYIGEDVGWGVIAKEDIERGTFVMEYIGVAHGLAQGGVRQRTCRLPVQDAVCLQGRSLT
jgi:hypothetical protein